MGAAWVTFGERGHDRLVGAAHVVALWFWTPTRCRWLSGRGDGATSTSTGPGVLRPGGRSARPISTPPPVARPVGTSFLGRPIDRWSPWCTGACHDHHGREWSYLRDTGRYADFACRRPAGRGQCVPLWPTLQRREPRGAGALPARHERSHLWRTHQTLRDLG